MKYIKLQEKKEGMKDGNSDLREKCIKRWRGLTKSRATKKRETR